MRAASSFCPPRLTKRCRRAQQRRRARRAPPGGPPCRPACPATRTRPAAMASWASCRLATRPRRTSSVSSRRRDPCAQLLDPGARWSSWRRPSWPGPSWPRVPSWPRGLLGRRLLGGLLGRRPSWRRSSCAGCLLARGSTGSPFGRLAGGLGRVAGRRLGRLGGALAAWAPFARGSWAPWWPAPSPLPWRCGRRRPSA